MVTLKEVSINNSMVAPKKSGGNNSAKCSELGIKNIAIAEIVRVNDLSSDAIIIQRISAITPGDQVQTIIDIAKQVQMITKTRRKLDTQKRLRPKTRPLKLEPQLVNEDTGQQRWSQRHFEAKNMEDQWFYITVGGGAATLLLLSGNFKLFSGTIGAMLPWIAGGGSVYSGMKYLKYRDVVSELTLEGRNRGFLSFQPIFRNRTSRGLQLVWSQPF